MALSAVLLPAPFGPMMPRMRPSSTWRSMPSTATVEPNALRRPWASMQVMTSAILLVAGVAFEQLLRLQAEPLDGLVDPRPLLGQELLALAGQQKIVGAVLDEHAEASLLLDEIVVDELLVGLEDRDRIDAILRPDVAPGRQRIAFLQHAVEDQGDDAVAKLPVDRLAVVPFTVHQALPESHDGAANGITSR